jgi:hypothetical protein
MQELINIFMQVPVQADFIHELNQLFGSNIICDEDRNYINFLT